MSLVIGLLVEFFEARNFKWFSLFVHVPDVFVHVAGDGEPFAALTAHVRPGLWLVRLEVDG